MNKFIGVNRAVLNLLKKKERFRKKLFFRYIGIDFELNFKTQFNIYPNQISVLIYDFFIYGISRPCLVLVYVYIYKIIMSYSLNYMNFFN